MKTRKENLPGADVAQSGADLTKRIATVDVWMDRRDRVHEGHWFLGFIMDTTNDEGFRAVRWECG